MKIGIVCYPTYGGSGVVATELGKALANRGHKVYFISYKQPARYDHFTANTFFHEVYVSNYPLFDFPPYETALTSHLVDVVKFEKLDLLHVHYAIPDASAAIMAKQILATDPNIKGLRAGRFKLFRRHPFHSTVSSNGHKSRCFNYTAVKHHPATTGFAVGR